jgi:NAD dependent epimerase/dehydratase
MDLSGFFQNKLVLVTGAGGFIGSHLVERLVAEGAKVRAFVRYNGRNDWGHLEQSPVKHDIELVSGDIADPYFVRQAVDGCAVVFHLAALIGIPYSYIAPQHYLNVNIQGTLNVLEACRSVGVEKLVVTSTSETYGTAQYTPQDEQHPLQGQSPYSASKIAADKLAESYYRSFGLPVATLRPFNTYGPRQSARAIIPTIATQARFANAITVGSLTPVRDFTYVTDTVDGFLRMAAHPETAGKVLNVGSGEAVTIGELVQELTALAGRPELPVVSAPERVRPEASEVQILRCDATQARQLLGWSPQVPRAEGLKRVLESLHQPSDKLVQYTV